MVPTRREALQPHGGDCLRVVRRLPDWSSYLPLYRNPYACKLIVLLTTQSPQHPKPAVNLE